MCVYTYMTCALHVETAKIRLQLPRLPVYTSHPSPFTPHPYVGLCLVLVKYDLRHSGEQITHVAVHSLNRNHIHLLCTCRHPSFATHYYCCCWATGTFRLVLFLSFSRTSFRDGHISDRGRVLLRFPIIWSSGLLMVYKYRHVRGTAEVMWCWRSL